MRPALTNPRAPGNRAIAGLALRGRRRAADLAARLAERAGLVPERRGWGPAERRTLGIGVLAAATTSAVVAAEFGRVWRRGSAPLPAEADGLLSAAEEAAAETVEVAVQGYQNVSSRENAMFNLLAAFVVTFASVRALTYVLRDRRSFGPFRDVRWGRRHIHHFVPGIVLAFASGTAAIATRSEELEPLLATSFGTGMGLTLDESALLLELEDVYWTQEGLLSVQITLAVTALMGAVALGLHFLRRGEQIVLDSDPGVPSVGASETPPEPASG